MNAMVMVITASIALAYMRRMEQLLYARNGVTFVLQNAISAGSGIYSTWDVATSGVEVSHVLICAMSILYLIRSRDTYFEEVTKPMELDVLDDRDFSRIGGGRK